MNCRARWGMVDTVCFMELLKNLVEAPFTNEPVLTTVSDRRTFESNI